MTKGMNDFCFLHQTGIFECITKDENGNLVIDPKQAEVVRRIYREYLEGYSMKSIALHLECLLGFFIDKLDFAKSDRSYLPYSIYA